MADKKLVSIVIPCYNEEKNINRTLDQLLDFIKSQKDDFEIIAINDGSNDNTWDVIKSYANKSHQIKGINLMTNHGLSQAYMAGFDKSKGDYVITVAADLEIPIYNIKKIIEQLDKGFDFVNTNRDGRWGSKSRSLPSAFANDLISRISGIKMQDVGSGMKGFKRVLIDNLVLYGEMHRMIPAYLSVYGAKMTEFDVEFRDRDYGKSAYGGLDRAVKVFFDIVTMYFMLFFARKPFKAMPGRLFGATGALISGVGGLGMFYLLVLKLMGESIGSRPLFLISVVLLIIGFQSMMMGMLGELMMRTYFEAGKRRTYTVRETIE